MRKGSLRRQYRWQNIRCYILLAAAGCLALAILLMTSCGGPTLPECRSASSAGARGAQLGGAAAASDAATSDGFEKVDS